MRDERGDALTEKITMRRIAALLILPLLAGPALAQTHVELTDLVPGTPGMRYVGLARVVAPDLTQVDGEYMGTVTLPVRSIPYPEDEPVVGLPLKFYSASAVTFTSDGIDLIGLLLEGDNPDSFGGEVLAVFDPAHQGTIIDLADVSSDQFTSFDEPTLLPLGERDDGLVVSSTHSNSSQGYRQTSVIAMLDGRLTEMASVFTFNENSCGMRREQTPALAPVTTDGEDRWAPFTITVTETTMATDDCDSLDSVVPGTHAVAATFMWTDEKGSYRADSNALDDLFEETEARF